MRARPFRSNGRLSPVNANWGSMYTMCLAKPGSRVMSWWVVASFDGPEALSAGVFVAGGSASRRLDWPSTSSTPNITSVILDTSLKGELRERLTVRRCRGAAARPTGPSRERWACELLPPYRDVSVTDV